MCLFSNSVYKTYIHFAFYSAVHIDLFVLDPWLFEELDQAVVCPKAWSSFNL